MKKPVAIRDFLSFSFVSNPAWSPDGSLCAFVVQQAQEAENRYTGDLYLYEASSGAVRRLTALGDAKSYCWTHQNTLLFPAARDKVDRDAVEAGELRTVYYEISPAGGEVIYGTLQNGVLSAGALSDLVPAEIQEQYLAYIDQMTQGTFMQ